MEEITDIVVPEVPKVIPNEQLYVYIPIANGENPGIVIYDPDYFTITNGVLTIKHSAYEQLGVIEGTYQPDETITDFSKDILVYTNNGIIENIYLKQTIDDVTQYVPILNATGAIIDGLEALEERVSSLETTVSGFNNRITQAENDASDAKTIAQNAAAAVNSKLDKVTSTSTLSKAYIKYPDGTQGMLDINPDYTDQSGDIVSRGTGGQIKVPLTPSLNNEAASKSYVDTGLSGKQPTLSQTQLDAVNSGINSSKVGQITTNQNNISIINSKIPVQASDQNQLADKDFVNSSIATNTAYFIGTFSSVIALENYSGTVTNNDYANVTNSELDFATTTEMNAYNKSLLTNYDYGWVVNGSKYDLYRFDIENQTWGIRATNISKGDVTLIEAYNRYTYNVTTTTWNWNYTVNTSGFTAVQWAAINSGATAEQITKIGTETLTTTAITLSGAINELDSGKQATLIGSGSGQNIKTINNTNILGTGNIDTTELYYCTYGTTTYAEITSALSAGKLPVCVYSNRFYKYDLKSPTDRYIFNASYADALYSLNIQSNDTWGAGNYQFEITSNKTQTINSSSTTSQYPSAKTVYDYSQPIIDSSHKLSADLVDDTSTTNKFVTTSEKTQITTNANDISNLQSTKANDNEVVHKVSNEDIYGLKTFDQRPKVGIEQELPSAYSRLDYIQSTDGQYIDVGYYPNNIKKSQIKLSFDSVSNEQWVLGMQASVGGALSHTGGQAFVMLQSGLIKYKIWGYDRSTSSFVTEHTYSSGVTAEVDKIYDIETMMISQSQYIKIDGSTLATSSVYRDNNASKNAYLFKGNTIGNPASIKLYSCKLYNYSDELIRDYVPCKRITDDAIGLYDFVSETFYASASTSFVAGPETVPSDDSLVMLKGDIQANETLEGTESNLESINIKGTIYKIPQPTTDTNQTIKVGTTTFGADDVVSLVAGNNVTITPDAVNKTITIASTGGGGGGGITNYEVVDRPATLPTASATTADIVQVSGTNYIKKKVIDLTSTTWLINSTPSMPTGDPIFSLNFTSNSSNFNIFYFITTGGYTDLIYAETGPTNIIHAYSEQDDEWSDGTEYQTIAITGGNDKSSATLYNWLVENATLQSGSPVSYEYEQIGGSANFHYIEEV